MVEVFKTNVADPRQAQALVDEIQSEFTQYAANFDLDDCDRILRVETHGNSIENIDIIGLLNSRGWGCEVLEDEPDSEIFFNRNAHKEGTMAAKEI